MSKDEQNAQETQRRKLKTDQQEPHKKPGWSHVLPTGKQTLHQMRRPSCCSCRYTPRKKSDFVGHIWGEMNTCMLCSVSGVWEEMTSTLSLLTTRSISQEKWTLGRNKYFLTMKYLNLVIIKHLISSLSVSWFPVI